ncbi:dephospho-CoA kinase [Corynebacterium glutamicum]|uniref:dephospho-CoA kinase n=1 Tax=Corynebacterium glutamicum TaxID=1718 RepID=UPI00058A577B|nr:dephospho-CoA kinase [Corynebacterium glutamicum]AJE67312.1 dephospho-CoA kinase [Corynebacterium glutamicum]OKX93381.1 dephospho-CoA kinase [Corynebacterium glutamicum]TWS38597.1 dephospho-CoA kinase [Corynebacterium glutamicum]
MLKIGLTGGIGSGKSTVADLLSSEEFLIIDADQIAREIVEPGQPALAELVEAFGPEIIKEDGSLDRQGLAAKAFVDAEHTALLNSITHPRIAEETARRFAEAEANGTKVAIYDMPLLVDKGLDRGMDLVLVVDVNVEERVRRLVEKRGLGEKDVRRRIDSQVPDEVRLKAADVVIDNNGSLEDLKANMKNVIAEILTRSH